MADRTIQIIVEVNDATGGALGGIQKSLLAMDKVVQRMQQKLRAFATQKFDATVRLIDRVTQPGSRINCFLKSLATKVYNITLRATDSATDKIRRIEASLMKLAGHAWTIAINVRDNVTNKVKGLTDGLLMGAGGMGVGMLGTAGIGYGALNAAQSYMNFEQQMSRVQAVANLDKHDEKMIQLVDKAKEMGATTEWTRAEAAQAEYYMAMAGWSPDKILAALPSVMHLASAGGTDLATTSDIVTDSMTGFRLNAGERFVDAAGRNVEASQHYADMMAKLVTSSNTNIAQLGEALKYSAPVVGAMYSDKDVQTRMHATEDAMVMSGLMANAGIKGSMAGTATRAIFSRFGSENRNAYNALRALNVDFTDESGEVRRIADVMKDVSKRFKEGVDPEQLLNFAEAISGEKIHADTRRKLDSFIENTQKNGGKMTGADMLKMSSMLAGQEAMSGLLSVLLGDWDELAAKIEDAHGAAEKMASVQLDNLSGDLKILGSAWDAFQQGFFEGQAGDGLREFVKSLTEIVSRAQKLFSDGIQIGDIGKVIFDVIDRLKNKFLELDGIGSVLAGGALMAGLMKVGSTIQKTIGYFRTLRGLEIGQRLGGTGAGTGGRPPTGLGGGQSVGTMNVTAGVVNVNGKVNGGAGGTSGRRVGDQTIIDRYNRERERIRGSGTPPPPPAPSRLSTMSSAAKGGAAFAAVFGALDFYNARSVSAERTQNAATELAAAEKEYRELQAQGVSQSELGEQAARIAELQAAQTQIAKENAINERQVLGGATGAVVGTAIGAALGSFFPGFGTMVGGFAGGIIGEKLGTAAASLGNDKAEVTAPNPKTDFFGFSEQKPTSTATISTPAPPAASMAAFRVAEDASRNHYMSYQRQQFQSTLQDREQGAIARQAKVERETASAAQIARFEKIDAKLSKTGASPFQHATAINTTADYYRQQREAMAKTPEQFNKANAATGGLTASFQKFGNFLDGFLFSKAAAAELTPEQLARQATMERGAPATTTSTPESLATPALETSETESFDFDNILSGVSNFADGVGEIFSGIGDSIFETLSDALDGVGEIFSGFGDTALETLSGALDGIGELLGSFGDIIGEGLYSVLDTVGLNIAFLTQSIAEGLVSAFEGASEMFSNFGSNLSAVFETASGIFSGFVELVSSSLATAQGAAESALSVIGSAFDSTKSAIQTAWGELPGFFSGIFSSLGGVAAAAGSAIYSGLTSVIGAVIGAWEGAAATVSGIISRISSMASSAASLIPSFGGKAFAEGGFVNSPTQALVGEAGAEVIIPLSSSRRARAMDLFEKTARILGGDAMSFGGDELANDFANAPFSDDTTLPASNFTGLDADTNVPTSNQSTSSNKISLGGIQATFNISGAENPQEILQTIREHLNELADDVAGRLAVTIGDIHGNQMLEG